MVGVIGLYLLSVLLAGCVSYRPLPLDHGTVAAKLQPPAMETVRLAAKEIHHPILRPINFDIQDGLSPEEAAILAVLANPKLRASRDQRKISTAQLLQAGILPNPQLSYSLDVPTGGMTQGTVNAFGFGLNWEITAIISRSAKVAAAEADAASVDLDVAWQEWQAAQAAKLQVYHLYYFDQQLAVIRQEENDLRENLDNIKRGADLGLVSVVDLAAAEAALQRLHSTRLTNEQQREDE